MYKYEFLFSDIPPYLIFALIPPIPVFHDSKKKFFIDYCQKSYPQNCG